MESHSIKKDVLNIDSGGSKRPVRRAALTGLTLAVFLVTQTLWLFTGVGTAAAATGAGGAGGGGGFPGVGPCMVTTDAQRLTYQATHLDWSKSDSKAATPSMLQNAEQLQGGVIYVNNVLGAAVTKIPAKYVANNADYESHRFPTIVMAVYNPQTSVGTIWVDRTLQMPNSDVLITQLPFGPTDGVVLSYAYNHNNPFWQFVPGANGNPTTASSGHPANPKAFVKVDAAGFFSAVGMVVKYFHAQRGLIATLDSRHELHTHSWGAFIRHTRTTIKYFTHPKWTIVLPSGTAPGGFTSGYRLPVCNSGTGAAQTFGAADAPDADVTQNKAFAKAQATLFSTNATHGGPAAVVNDNQIWPALTVPSGVQFIQQGAKPLNLDTAEWLSYQYSKTHSGLGIIVVVLATVVLSAVTWGVGSAVAAGLNTAAATTIANVGTMVGIAESTPAFFVGLTVGAGVGVATSAATILTGGSLNAPTGSGPVDFMYSHSGDIGGASPTITTYDYNNYLALLQSANAGNTVATSDVSNHPTSPDHAFNGNVGALTQQSTRSTQAALPGSIGSQFDKARVASSQGVTTASSDAARKPYVGQYGQSTGVGLPPPPSW